MRTNSLSRSSSAGSPPFSERRALEIDATTQMIQLEIGLAVPAVGIAGLRTGLIIGVEPG